MDKKVWIWTGVILGVMMLTCCASIGWLVMTKGKDAIAVLKEASEYTNYSAEISESNDFSTQLTGGGNFSFSEIGIRTGGKIRRWTKTDGWESVSEKNISVPFEFDQAYVIGWVTGRTGANPRVRSELGAMKLLPSGEFWLDVYFTDGEWSAIEFGDGEYEVNGSWSPGGKASGKLEKHSDFRLGEVADVEADAELWPIYEFMDVEWLDPAKTQGFIHKVSEWDMTWQDIQVVFVLKSGEQVSSDVWTFYDGKGDIWWVWPFSGNLNDVERVDYLERACNDVEIIGVDFSGR